MRSFVRLIELWGLNEACTKLEYRGGLCSPELLEFRDVSEFALFGCDEGLPGKAWALRRPVMFTDLSQPDFKRADEARQAGLTCGIALPVCMQQTLAGVVVFFFGEEQQHTGAIELWHNDPDVSPEMQLFGGYYGTARRFELESRHTTLLRGYGLPGRAWKADRPVLMKNLSDSRQFLRRSEALEAGINCGLALPYRDGDQTWVVSMLSARQNPLARRIEIWAADAAHDNLRFETGYCEQVEDLAPGHGSLLIGKGEGTIGTAWATGKPVLLADLHNDSSATAKLAVKAGLTQLVVLPFVRDSRAEAAVAIYL